MKNKLVLILWLELQDSLMASGIKRTILDEMIMATDTLLFMIQKLFQIIYEIQKRISDHALCKDATKVKSA